MGIFDIFKRGVSVPEARADNSVPQGAPPQEDYKDLPVTSLEQWNPTKIREALGGHQIGNFSAAARLTEGVLGDGRVQTALNGRIKGISMRHAHIATPGGAYDAECLEMWRRVFTDEVLDQIFTWTVFLGFCVCEIQWNMRRINGEELWVPELKPWHPQFIYYNVATRKYVAITAEGAVEIEENDPKWWVFTPWGSYRGWLRGAIRAVAPLWALRQYAMRDFARFSEVHGFPIKVLKSPAQSNERDKARMFGQVANLNGMSTMLLPRQTGADGTEWVLELLEAKDQAWKAFPGLIDICDREIQQVLRGTNLTSEVQGGSYAAAQVHADEDSAYADSDCRKLCDSSFRLVELFCGFNFGASEEATRIRLEPPDKQDKLALAQSQQFVMTWLKAAREEGIVVDKKRVCEQFNIPVTKVVDLPIGPQPKEPTLPGAASAMRTRAFLAEFREEDHPRRDDGKFGTGGGGSRGKDEGGEGEKKGPLPHDSTKYSELDGAELISSQRYLNDEIVEEKREARDYGVLVSPPFEIDGEWMRVVMDGHHSFAAARLDGVEPEYTTAKDNESLDLLKAGDVEGFLEAVYGGDSYYSIGSGKDKF